MNCLVLDAEHIIHLFLKHNEHLWAYRCPKPHVLFLGCPILHVREMTLNRSDMVCPKTYIKRWQDPQVALRRGASLCFHSTVDVLSYGSSKEQKTNESSPASCNLTGNFIRISHFLFTKFKRTFTLMCDFKNSNDVLIKEK